MCVQTSIKVKRCKFCSNPKMDYTLCAIGLNERVFTITLFANIEMSLRRHNSNALVVPWNGVITSIENICCIAPSFTKRLQFENHTYMCASVVITRSISASYVVLVCVTFGFVKRHCMAYSLIYNSLKFNFSVKYAWMKRMHTCNSL